MAENLSTAAAYELIHQLRRRLAEMEVHEEDYRRLVEELRSERERLRRELGAAQDSRARATGTHDCAAGIIEGLKDGLGILDHRLVFIYINPQAAAILGRPAAEVVGRPLGEVFPSCRDSGLEDMLLRVQREQRPAAGFAFGAAAGSRCQIRACPHEVGVAVFFQKEAEPPEAEKIHHIQARILENLAEGVVLTDRRGIILYTNPAFDAMFGYRRRELLKQSSHVLNCYPPEENRQRLREILRSLEASGSWSGELQGRRQDGSPFTSWVRITSFVVGERKFYVSLQADITAQRQAEKELQRLASFPELNPNPVLEVDSQGQVLYANPAAREAAARLSKPEGVAGFVPPNLPELTRQAREEGRRQQVVELAWGDEAYLVYISFPDDLPTVRLYVLPVTERRRAEAALREREARLSSIFAAAPLGIGLVQNRIIKEVNQELCRMLGYAPEELVEHSARMLYPTQEEFEQVGQEKYRQVAVKGVGAVTTRWRRKDGAILDIYLSSSPLKPGEPEAGMTFTALDITELKRARQALQESEERYRSLFQNSHAVMFLIDPDTGAIHDANPTACQYYGYSREKLLTMKIQDINTLPREEVFQAMKRARQSDNTTFQFRHRLASGEIRDVEVYSGPITIRGKTFLFSIVHDITARKQAEAALLRAHQELEQRVTERTAALRLANVQLLKEMDERLQAETKLKESQRKLRFLADQLLTAQENERKRLAAELHDELGHALLILKLSLSSVEKELLPGQEAIKEEIQSKLQFLKEVIARVRRLYRALSPAELEYLGLTQALLSMIDEMAAYQPQVSWLVDLPELDNLFTPAVQTIIYRVIQEALTNVGKHANPSQVAIIARRDGDRVWFFVEDDGQGFDPASVLGPEASGGLGLATMEERVHMAGGTLDLQSTVGRGTSLVFTIPVSPEGAEP